MTKKTSGKEDREKTTVEKKAGAGRGVGKRTKSFSPYFTDEEADQVRAAFLAVGHLEGDASVSDFIVRATMREVKRLQRKHNQGRKWDPAPAGVLRRGQRTRDELQHRHEDG